MKDLRNDLSLLIEKVDNIFKLKDVLKLTSLRERYILIMKSPISNNDKLQRLNKILLLSMANIERLLAIQADLSMVYSEMKRLNALARKKIISKIDTISAKKKDIDTLIFLRAGDFKLALDDVETKLTIINNSLETLNKTQFALKSVMSNLKEDIHDYRR